MQKVLVELCVPKWRAANKLVLLWHSTPPAGLLFGNSVFVIHSSHHTVVVSLWDESPSNTHNSVAHAKVLFGTVIVTSIEALSPEVYESTGVL